MPNTTKKIGWQKYEDYIEKQLSCPILQSILQHMFANESEDEEEDEDEEDETYEESDSKKHSLSLAINKMLPLTPQIIDDISMLANFDCWIGHSNFDITPKIKDKLNKIPGVEILKIFSRYRFFVGIGQMFDFQNVRHEINKELTRGEFDEQLHK